MNTNAEREDAFDGTPTGTGIPADAEDTTDSASDTSRGGDTCCPHCKRQLDPDDQRIKFDYGCPLCHERSEMSTAEPIEIHSDVSMSADPVRGGAQQEVLKDQYLREMSRARRQRQLGALSGDQRARRYRRWTVWRGAGLHRLLNHIRRWGFG